MAKIDDGGAAFPVPYGNSAYGMSLRDYFAGQALSGQLSFSPHDSFDKYHQPDEVAAACYRFADAMLAARKKES
ncbi:hypothetical protein [Rhizobium leucaenae]|uniref:hypothetical protein n=1 Tax=Rhizobium leucaenae TaxID=29450 RepID=UPI0004045160|nr:hypothetical protein [Rhizobium leucaenae]